jgi:hypothetical protein
MPIVVNEVSVDAAPAPPPAPAAAAAPPPSGNSDAAIADAAERHWKRVAELQERLRAD